MVKEGVRNQYRTNRMFKSFEDLVNAKSIASRLYGVVQLAWFLRL